MDKQFTGKLSDEQKKQLKNYYKAVASLPRWAALTRNGGEMSAKLQGIIDAICNLPKAPKSCKWVYTLAEPRNMKQPTVPTPPLQDLVEVYETIWSRGLVVEHPFYSSERLSDYAYIKNKPFMPSLEPAKVGDEVFSLQNVNADALFKAVKRIKMNAGEQMQINVNLVKAGKPINSYNLGVIGYDGQQYVICANTVDMVKMAVDNNLIPKVDAELITTADAFASLAKSENELQEYLKEAKEKARKEKEMRDAEEKGEAFAFFNKVADMYELSDLSYECLLDAIKNNRNIVLRNAFQSTGRNAIPEYRPNEVDRIRVADEDYKYPYEETGIRVADDEIVRNGFVDLCQYVKDENEDNNDNQSNETQRDDTIVYKPTPEETQEQITTKAEKEIEQNENEKEKEPVMPPKEVAEIIEQAEKETNPYNIYIGSLNVSDNVGNLNFVIGSNNVKIKQNDNTITR